MNFGLARDHFVIVLWPIGRCRDADRTGERSNDRAQMTAPHSYSSTISFLEWIAAGKGRAERWHELTRAVWLQGNTNGWSNSIVRAPYLISCRFKKSKQPFDIADALSNHDAEFGKMRTN